MMARSRVETLANMPTPSDWLARQPHFRTVPLRLSSRAAPAQPGRVSRGHYPRARTILRIGLLLGPGLRNLAQIRGGFRRFGILLGPGLRNLAQIRGGFRCFGVLLGPGLRNLVQIRGDFRRFGLLLWPGLGNMAQTRLEP